LGDGVIDVKGVCEVLKDAGIESSTLEIIGSEDILKKSVEFLQANGM
jgi:inosose dehydratase